MNEVLLKELIRRKLAVASRIVGLLPPELSGDIKSVGRILRECLSEDTGTRQQEVINNIRID